VTIIPTKLDILLLNEIHRDLYNLCKIDNDDKMCIIKLDKIKFLLSARDLIRGEYRELYRILTNVSSNYLLI